MANMLGLSEHYKVLIVDDEKTICHTLAAIFAKCGYEASVAYSAEQAIEMITGWQPNLAILDVGLPNMNGVDLAIALKANRSACRILLFSGQSDTADLLERAAADGHPFEILAKPVHPSLMLDAAAKLLSANPERNGSDCPRPSLAARTSEAIKSHTIH